MGWITYAAVYFIIWWVTLFAVLPFGLRTQEEDQNVAPGTVESAPSGPHLRRAMLWTTLVAAVICLGLFVMLDVFGIGLEDMPHIIPAT